MTKEKQDTATPIANQIEQAKKEWEVTADSLPQLICLLNRQQQVIRANRTVERWGLLQIVAVKGQPIHSLLHPVCKPTVCYFTEFLQTAWESLHQNEAIELEINDTILGRYLHIQLRPVAGKESFANPEASFATLVIQDITEQRRAQDILQKSHDELERRVTERTKELAQTNQALKVEIMERKRAEETLRLFEAAVNGSIDGITISDPTQPDNPIIYANPGFVRLTGYQIEDVLGKNCRFLQNGDIEQPELDRLRKAIAVGEECRVLLRNYHKNGTLFWNELTVYPLYNHIGQLTHFVGIQRNTTERKRAEQMLRHSEARYRRRARELQTLYTASRVITSTLDLQTVLNQMVDEMKQLFEAEGGAVLLHQPQTGGFIFTAVSVPNGKKLLGHKIPFDASIAEQVIVTGKPLLVENIQRNPQFYRPIDELTGLTTNTLLIIPLVYKHRAIGTVELFNPAQSKFYLDNIDLLDSLANSAAIAIENARLYETERRQYRLLQKSQAHLIEIEKMAALGRLMASITHEINNPLQSVMGFLMLAQQITTHEDKTDDLKHYVDTAVREIRRIAELMGGMRKFYHNQRYTEATSSIDTVDQFYQAVREVAEPVNVSNVLEEVLQLTSKQLQDHHITLERQGTKIPVMIMGSASHLNQVFLNLVLNALDAMEDIEGTLTISIEPGEIILPNAETQRAVQIRFQDTGSGMPAAVSSRVFEPLFTTKSHGSGIGLFTSYKIITSHEGQITVESEEGIGTTFTILLPLITDPQP